MRTVVKLFDYIDYLIDNCDIYQLIDLWQTVMTILISPFLSRLPFCCWSRLACRRYWTFDQHFHSSLTFHIKGSHQRKKVTKLRTFSVPPLAPPPPRIYGHLWGSFF